MQNSEHSLQDPGTPNKTPVRRKLMAKPFSWQDKAFFYTVRVAAGSSLVLVALIFAFLLARSLPALQEQGLGFVTGSVWDSSKTPAVLQIGSMLWGSILIAFLGIILAVPMSVAVSYFIVFLAGKRVKAIATTLIDLLAALPSIVIGLWGIAVFAPVGAEWSQLMNKFLGWLPFFSSSTNNFLGTPFIAGWIVAVMIVPIISSVTREIFSQMDRELINAALALGGSKASTFLKVILPTASGGIVGGVLLGLGRALGETVAIFFVLNLSFDINWAGVIESRGGSIASMILSKFGEADPKTEIPALLAAGLVLFIVTLIVNSLAAVIVDKAQPWRKI